MLEIKVNLTELKEFTDKIPGFDSAIIAEQQYAMHASLSVLEQAVTVRTPVGVSGAAGLRGGWSQQVSGTPALQVGELHNPLDYAWAIEAGRKPGNMPPPDSLLLWVTRKLGVTGQAAKSLAFVIARSIGQKGTKGFFMVRDGWAQAEPIIIRLHEAIPEKAISKLL